VGGVGAPPRGAVGVASVSATGSGSRSGSGSGSDILRLSLDVSAVPANPVGAGRYTIHLTEALERRGDVALTLWCRRGDGGRWGAVTRSDLDLPARAASGAVPTVRAVAPKGRPGRLVWEQVRLPGLLAGSDAQVHHGPHYTMPERARLAKVVTIHDLTFLDHPEWHERSKVRVFRRAIRSAARGATGLICVSATTAARLEELCHPIGRVFVIPHGIDHGEFRPGEPFAGADGEVLGRLGVTPPYIVFVGTLEPRKAVPDLVAAFDRMAEGHRELSLVLAGGDGWGLADIERSISSARHGDRVVRTGYVPDNAVPALLRQAAVAAYPSVEEGFGLPALEALACGTPLVTTAQTAMAEVSGDAGVLVPAGAVGDLAEALEAQIAGGPEVEDRRRRGIERAGSFTWEECAEKHMEAYRWAAGRAGAVADGADEADAAPGGGRGGEDGDR
jgi:glycosyltransferase involved in cell wall biosynthesis